MARLASTVFSNFNSRLHALEITRSKVERLASRGELVRRDVEKVYESLFLKAFTELESNIEELFIGLLTKRILPSSRDIIPRIVFKSDLVAREIVYGGRNYFDWFPYDRTIMLSEAFFRAGRPFTELDNADRRKCENLLLIRNAIAHNSAHATRQFINKVIGATPLLSRERTPSGFLRSQIVSLSSSQTRFEFFMMEMRALVQKLSS